MKRVGCGEGEKICFIFDESNCLSSGFLEAMNALLASGEVPGLFEGDDLVALMNGVRVGGESDEEAFRRFTLRVQKNLHVVFTMNPSGADFKNRSTTSPALFNRCVVDWFGTWGNTALEQVGKEFTRFVDVNGGDEERENLVSSLVMIHNETKSLCEETAGLKGDKSYISPRDYLDFIKNFVKIVSERRAKLEDEQMHINVGLSKLISTEEKVAEMKSQLSLKSVELKSKDALANTKLMKMVSDQNVAEKRKELAEKLAVEVARQQSEIERRTEEASGELESAEPALIAAQESVKGIKKVRDGEEGRGGGATSNY